MKKVLFGILICLFTIGCNKPNPAPELTDPIYLDIQTNISNAEKEIDAEKALLMEARGLIAEAIPQTSQMKWAQKRFYESTARMDRLNQKLTFWRLKAATRKQLAQQEYLKAWYKKEPWPSPEEYKSWKSDQAIRRNPGVWNIERRFEELGVHYTNPRLPASVEKKKSPNPAQAQAEGGEHR